MRFFNQYKSIVISDIPLGASPEHLKKLIYFIKNTSCDQLILSGDIIKGWKLKKIGKYYKLQNKFLKTLLKVSERDNTRIIFITGEDWDYKENIDCFKFCNFYFVKNYKFESGSKTMYISSGDISQEMKTSLFTLQPLRKYKYLFLLWLNNKYNWYRTSKGKKYKSLLKQYDKFTHDLTAMEYFKEDYELSLKDLAAQNECEGIIYGHQAYTGVHRLGSLVFLSSGYWTETLSALTESNYGEWNVLYFEKIVNDKLEAIQPGIFEELHEAEKELYS